MDVNSLLAGPRGRLLVWHLGRTSELWDLEHRARAASANGAASFGWFSDGTARRGPLHLVDNMRHHRERKAHVRHMHTPPTTDEVVRALAEHLPSGPFDDVAIAEAFVGTVNAAQYWQPPDAIEQLLAHPDAIDVMRSAAQAVLETPLTRDWAAPVAHLQWRVEFQRGGRGEPDLPEFLDAWAAQVRADEVEADVNASGSWWSAPLFAARATTGAWPGIGPAGLFLVEDQSGWDTANVTPIEAPSTKVLEITSAEAWAELCRAHPLEVTRLKAHDWGSTTGRSGAWVMPDWSTVAKEWDGVHLTYAAYLEGATRAIQVEPGTASVIAGWAPDATFWFVPTPASGTATRWRRGDTFGWREVGA